MLTKYILLLIIQAHLFATPLLLRYNKGFNRLIEISSGLAHWKQCAFLLYYSIFRSENKLLHSENKYLIPKPSPFFCSIITLKNLLMKRILLLTMLFTASIVYAQIPTDYEARYDFTNTSLINNADPGNGDLVPSSPTGFVFVNDRDGNSANALSPKQRTFDGATTTTNSNSFTISFWYQHENDAVSGNPERILQLFDQGGDGFAIRKVGNSFVFRLTALATNEQLVSIPSLIDGNWHHVAWVVNYSSGTYDSTVYIDNVVNSTLSSGLDWTINNPLFNSPSQFRISPLISQLGLRSAVDDIRLYLRPLSSAEVSSLYSEPAPVGSSIIYVDPNATGTGIGDSWANAATSIQSALAIVSSGGQVWVKSGTYKPTNGSDRLISFVITQNVEIYGGFNGTESNLSDRDLINNAPTIITGDLSDNDNNLVQDSNPTYNDNSTTLFRINGSNVTIDGFTLQSTYASGTGVNGTGGAIFIDNIIPEDITISNCIIERHVARGAGAGIFYQPITSNAPEVSLEVSNTIIRNNASRYGTGIYYFSDHPNAKLLVINSLFYDNKSIQTAQGAGAFGSSIWGRSLGFSKKIFIDIINSAFIDNQELHNGFGNSIPQDRRSTIAITNTDGSDNDAILNVYNSIFHNNTNFLTNTPCPIGRALGNRGAVFNIDTNIDAGGFSEIVATVVTGTLTTSPTFQDYANDDFRLANGSSGIDVGNNSIISTFNIVGDLAGNNRIANTTVDIGPYEFGSSLLNIDDYSLDNNIHLYPNPTDFMLNIETKSQLQQIRIYNLLGELIIVSKVNTINVSDLKSGVYILKIEDTFGRTQSKRFIKN